MKNIVFDLGGVVFARDPQKCEKEFIDFFAFIIMENMPEFWVDYDRGKVSYDDVVEALSKYHGCTREVAEGHMRTAIGMQEEIRWTKELVADLKRAGYRQKRIFEILLSRYALVPEETLFVDDRKDNVEAAESMGIHAFLFDYRNPRESCERLRGMLLR